MEATQQPPAAAGTPCANCSAPMAPDQRYCLNCGHRRGDPRVPAPVFAPVDEAPEVAASRPADVSPLAAVIGIALLGGMLLIGVLIGRETGGDDTTPAPVVQVQSTTGEATTGGATTPAPPPADDPAGAGDSAGIVSEWPEATDGWTIQLSATPKADATPETIASAKQGAMDQGATDAAVLDSDLFSSLPPAQWIVYSGVYTDQKSAEAGLKALGKNFANATVIEVSGGGGGAAAPPAGGADELSPEVGGGE